MNEEKNNNCDSRKERKAKKHERRETQKQNSTKNRIVKERNKSNKKR